MSLDENKAICRRVFDEMWSQGNVDLIDEIIASDFVGQPGYTTLRGKQELRDGVVYLRGAFPDLTFTVTDQLAADDQVVTRWTASGTHDGLLGTVQPTGKNVEFTGVTIHRLAEGKIVTGWSKWDILLVLQALDAVPDVGLGAPARDGATGT